MKEIKRWHLSIPTSDNPRTLGEIKQDDKGEYVLYLDRLNEVKQLQARIKELESQSHINEIKAQGIEDMLNDDVFKEYVRYSLKGLETTEVDDYTYLENVRNYAKQLRTIHD